MFKQFGLVMVVVTEMDRSVAFYRDVLGLRLKVATPAWSEFDVGGVGLGLHIADKPGGSLEVRGHGVQFGFYTDDLDTTLAELRARGAPVIHQSDEAFGRIAAIVDPDGHPIQICQLKPRG